MVAVHDTLREVTTITIRQNEAGDTVKQSVVTDRYRGRNAEAAKVDFPLRAVELNLHDERLTVQRDTVYIEKRDSVFVQNTDLTNPTNTTKGSGLSELFLCHDSGKPNRAWSLRSLLHRFRATLKWIFWILIGLIGLIITEKVCLLRR